MDRALAAHEPFQGVPSARTAGLSLVQSAAIEVVMVAKIGLFYVAAFALILGSPLAKAGTEKMAEKPLATIPGDTQGIHIDILSLKRSEGNMLTLHVAFVNESGARVKDNAFPGMDGSGWRVSLLDYQARIKYGVIEFSDGSCLCTTNLVYNADFEPGRKVLWAKFRAPPESVRKIALLAGSGEPVEELPITR
jgi:hypothetical protein